ncbi:hypothetical protein HDU77_011732 [Chytriomyces hyalinus]|nr:hypothetical protein HDU77_011732 [Chytriomyces hyalinus]
MLVAYREFQMISNDSIADIRKSLQLKVIQGLDMYAKRSVIRNLNFNPKFNKDELLFLCDQYHSVLYYHRHGKRKGTARLNFENFVPFLTRLTPWGRFDLTLEGEDEDVLSGRSTPTSKLLPTVGTANCQKLPAVGVHFLNCLFDHLFDLNHNSMIEFSDIVSSLLKLIHCDLMDHIGLFFTLHDEDRDGLLNKEGIVQFTESLFFLLRKEDGDKYLNSMISAAAASGEIPPLLDGGDSREQPLMLPIAVFRELILGDPFFVEYFDTGFRATFALQEIKIQEMMDSIWQGRVSWANRMGWSKRAGKKAEGGTAAAVAVAGKDDESEDEEEGYDLLDKVGKTLDVQTAV